MYVCTMWLHFTHCISLGTINNIFSTTYAQFICTLVLHFVYSSIHLPQIVQCYVYISQLTSNYFTCIVLYCIIIIPHGASCIVKAKLNCYGQANTRHRNNAVPKLRQRLRRWPSIETTLRRRIALLRC